MTDERLPCDGVRFPRGRVTERWAATHIALALDDRPLADRLSNVRGRALMTEAEHWEMQVLLHNTPTRELREAVLDEDVPYCSNGIRFSYDPGRGDPPRDRLLPYEKLATYTPTAGEWPRPANLGMASPHPPGCLATWLMALDHWRNEGEHRPGGGRPSDHDVKGAICALVRIVDKVRPAETMSAQMCVATLIWLEVLYGDTLPPLNGWEPLHWAERLGLTPVVETSPGIATAASMSKLTRQIHNLATPMGGRSGAPPLWTLRGTSLLKGDALTSGERKPGR